ncbi:hypothetical protein [Arthrobacter sp. FW306-07-I]|uniref:hypothetical protein n=1 Tax=Arthrobacter sp. FW306-07-I TaxID=2879622 RepID=UPI003018967E
MASDSADRADYPPGNTVSLSLEGDDEVNLGKHWAHICGGGTVTMPLERAPWGDAFGMCMDKFGISWMVNIEGPRKTTEQVSMTV